MTTNKHKLPFMEVSNLFDVAEDVLLLAENGERHLGVGLYEAHVVGHKETQLSYKLFLSTQQTLDQLTAGTTSTSVGLICRILKLTLRYNSS